MTRLQHLTALRDKVKDGEKCIVPSPRVDGFEARVMGYVEGYVVMRHKSCIPFLEGQKRMVRFLEALIAQEGGE